MPGMVNLGRESIVCTLLQSYLTIGSQYSFSSRVSIYLPIEHFGDPVRSIVDDFCVRDMSMKRDS